MMIDLSMAIKLPDGEKDFETGFYEAVEIAKLLSKHKRFSNRWYCYAGNIVDDLDEVRSYFAKGSMNQEEGGDLFTVQFLNEGAEECLERPNELNYHYGSFLNRTILKFPCYDHVNGMHYDNLVPVLKTLIDYRRPLHMSLGSVSYAMHDHPLSRRRGGIRWIGWVPFVLSPKDIPDAEVVESYRNGTFVASQRAFWQPDEGMIGFSKEAIERTQSVEISMAQLGVLPTHQDLTSGAWGS